MPDGSFLHFLGQSPDEIDRWFPRLGLPETEKIAPGVWRARATWSADRPLWRDREAEERSARLWRAAYRAGVLADRSFTDHRINRSVRLQEVAEEHDRRSLVAWPDDLPHYITVDHAGDILCDGMERQIWNALDFVALAKGYVSEDGEFQSERAAAFLSGASDPVDCSSKTTLSRSEQIFAAFEAASDVKPVLRNRYLVKGWIDQGTMTVIYGQSNSGKSFFAADLCAHIAAGLEWNGYRVADIGARHVLYIVAEGGTGFRNRIDAIRRARPELNLDRLIILPISLDFFRQEDGQAMLHAMARAGLSPALIAVDTLARTFGDGDENTSKDMGVYIANLDEIRAELSCAVAIVHHSGKDQSKGARGSGALRAATDTEIEITEEGGIRYASQRKQRDMAIGGPFTFRLEEVGIGLDEDGDPVSSAVVQPVQVDVNSPEARGERLTGQAGAALRILETLIGSYGAPIQTALVSSAGSPAIEEAQWQEACAESGLSSGSTPDAGRMAFNRAAAKLERAKLIKRVAGYVWRTPNTPNNPEHFRTCSAPNTEQNEHPPLGGVRMFGSFGEPK